MAEFIRRGKQRIRQRIWHWLDQRVPAVAQARLRQHSLFVFPTRFGFSLVALVILLYVLGTNYQNNLIILLAYLLLVLFVGSIVLSFLNLHHTTIEAHAVADAHVGDQAQIVIQFARADGMPQALFCSWQEQPLQVVTSSQLLLPLAADRRGFHLLPRLKLQSVYPFGLIRCWSYIRLDTRYWVFPAPVASPYTAAIADKNPDSVDEWADLRLYQPGDSLRQLDWKRLSRQQQLLVHQYRAATVPSVELWLEPDPLLAGVEAQLSDLAARALRAVDQQQPFGLRLGQVTVGIGEGQAHLRRVLQELALC